MTYWWTRSREDKRSRGRNNRLVAHLRSLCMDLAESIEGVGEREVCLRSASLLFNRLIFLYFLQHMGLLSGDPLYLQNHLRLFQERQEEGTGFYREFLFPLFSCFDQSRDCSVPLKSLFPSRSIEQTCPGISIPDKVFAQIFTTFDAYPWQLHAGTVYNAGTVTPDILGEFLELGMRPKEMGAYYTPDEITSYIVHNTLLPALFTRLCEHCEEACIPDALFWRCLVQQPERYMYASAYKGCEYPLPAEIAAGLQDVARRRIWQQRASDPYALLGETWREVISRREHTGAILGKLRQSVGGNLDRLVTWNLNQQLLALDALRNCQEPAFLAAFYQSLRQLAILDPTCGSGAFLCEALAHLEPLYVACLTRMEEMCSQSAALASPYDRSFRTCLEEVGSATQRRQAILCWIIEHNLYGVDLAEEAVEVCRLCLYLKVLAASSNCTPTRLSDDFGRHIDVGNSLLGPLRVEADEQVSQRVDVPGQLAFHWSRAFPEPMGRGGFDVVLGNPPYVEYEKVRSLYSVDGYATMKTGNLYALTIERSTDLLAPGGRFGMIVPSSATCTDGYRPLQKLLLAQKELHVASFSDQRGRLFALPHPRLCILLYKKADPARPGPGRVFATPYLKFGEESRSCLLEHLSYTEVTYQVRPGVIPRYGSSLEKSISAKLSRQEHSLGYYLNSAGAYPVYYTRKLSWFVQVPPFVPLILDAQGKARAPSEMKILRFTPPDQAQVAFVALNSNLFYWLVTTSSDCRNLNMREVLGLPLDLAKIHPRLVGELCQLSQELECDLRKHARMCPLSVRGRGRLTIQCIYPARSKWLIDEIDRVLARHYGFSAEELDFLLYYDDKYRRGRAGV